jgi:transcriptional antiterminator RfaH
MSTISEGQWYVVQTQVNAEMKAARNLMHQGFEIYLPRYLKRRSHARKVEKVAAPLFPRYMFVRIDITRQRWRSIQSTLGVSRLVTNGSDPAPVDRDVLKVLKARESKDGFIEVDYRPHFSIGEKVRVLAGAFMDSSGLFNGMADHDRVSILLDMLGRKVRVCLDADLVAAA